MKNQAQSIILLIISIQQNSDAKKVLKRMKAKIDEIAKSFDEKIPPMEWVKVYRQDKGKLDDDADFAKKTLANASQNQQLRADMLQKDVIEFSFPLRFCIAPFFQFNQRVFCAQNFKVLKDRNECLNQFCMLCCGLGQDMLVDTANNQASPSKELEETLTPGFNIISKVVTNDEIVFCQDLCMRFYPIVKPQIAPSPPKINHLGEQENPKTQPVAWSCNDILKWEVTQSTDPKNGYYYIKLDEIVQKAYCDIINGGQTLFMNQVAQGSPERVVKAMGQVAGKAPEGPVDSKMFPQHILGVDEQSSLRTDTTIRVNEEKQVPITSTHFNLDKVIPFDKEDEIPVNKLKEIWLFCVAFYVAPNEETEKDEIVTEKMISVVTDKMGLLKTAMTGNRADMEDSWLFESRDLVPKEVEFGDIDDPDDLPQFQLLNKFKPEQMFEKDEATKETKANMFRRANSKENFHNRIKEPFTEQGFVNDLFFTMEDISEKPEKTNPDIQKWTVNQNDDSDPAGNGKYNCDSNYEKESAAKQTFLHQAQFKMQDPPVPEVIKRTDKQDLWPKV